LAEWLSLFRAVFASGKSLKNLFVVHPENVIFFYFLCRTPKSSEGDTAVTEREGYSV
jgi:hypothetical protein